MVCLFSFSRGTWRATLASQTSPTRSTGNLWREALSLPSWWSVSETTTPVGGFVPHWCVCPIAFYWNCVCLNGIILCVCGRVNAQGCLLSVLVSLCRCVFPSTALHTHKHTCGHLSVCSHISAQVGHQICLWEAKACSVSGALSDSQCCTHWKNKSINLPFSSFPLVGRSGFFVAYKKHKHKPTQNHLGFDLLGLYQNYEEYMAA